MSGVTVMSKLQFPFDTFSKTMRPAGLPILCVNYCPSTRLVGSCKALVQGTGGSIVSSNVKKLV